MASYVEDFALHLLCCKAKLARGSTLANSSGIVGELGELYVAIQLGGTMVEGVNQPGFDVLSPAGERVSVKTVTGRHRYAHFRESTFAFVDRVVIVFVEVDLSGDITLEIVYDGTSARTREISRKKAKGGFYVDQKNQTPTRSGRLLQGDA
jgi:hypothetical protein